MKISEWIDFCLIFGWIEIQNIVDRYLFHTKHCIEHGYECHRRCRLDQKQKKTIYINKF